ncbi:MAG: hypothetical protein HY701_08025 [Gemmatimonadetes bacterium]|nr:hypothetical protein [Gemmatimonadota bacterium]
MVAHAEVGDREKPRWRVAARRTLVERVESGGRFPADLRAEVDRVIGRQWSSGDPLAQRLPLVAGHHDVELALGGLADLVRPHFCRGVSRSIELHAMARV